MGNRQHTMERRLQKHHKEPKKLQKLSQPEAIAVLNASAFYPFEMRLLRKLPIRDVQIHMICIDQKMLDDSLLLWKHGCRHYKICGVRVSKDYNSYVSGIQAKYLNLQTQEVIVGGEGMVGSGASEEWFELKKDEYLVEVIGRTGMIIDKLGFMTNTDRKYSVGGEGGDPFSYRLPQGYHVGALSATKKSFLQGIQFDKLAIDTEKHKIQQKPFEFFESEASFGYLIEYLSVKEVMRLFLVSRKVAEFRKTSQKFWLKCLALYDRVTVSYLQGLASAFKIEQLDTYLQKYYAVKDLKLVNLEYTNSRFASRLDLEQLSTELKQDQSYLIVVGVEFKNSVFAFKDCYFRMLLECEEIFQSKFRNEEVSFRGKIAPLHTRKFAIFLTWNQATREVLKRVVLDANINSTWYDAYMAEIVYKYAMYLQCGVSDLVQQNFGKLANGVLVSHMNSIYLKFDR